MKRRYCELNLLESTSLDTNVQNIKNLMKLGYSVVAVNRNMDLPTQINKHTLKLSDAEIHSFARSMEKLKNIVDDLKKGTSKTESTTQTDVDFSIPDDFELLSRVTVEIESPDQGRFLKMSPYKDMLDGVDIIAISLKNEAVYKSIMDRRIDCDIISLHLTDTTFKLTRQLVGMAVNDLRVGFEIAYSHAIKSMSLRKSIFQNGRLLVQRTKRAKGVILSCHSDHSLDFRSPRDVVNMAHLFDVDDNVSHDVVSKNCWDVIAHARLRKHTYRGAVVVEEVTPKHTEENQVPAKKRKIGADV